MYGDTVVQVTDPDSGVVNTIQFQRPNEIPIFASVTVQNRNSSYEDIVVAVQQAIINTAAGQVSGYPRINIMGSIVAFELAGGANSALQNVVITDLKIGRVYESLNYSTINLHVDEFPVFSPENIAVTVL
jgi:hypothetical protein